MMISVIVATRDRAPLLKSTLEALCAQVSPGCPVEILVADNGSIDETRQVVRAAARESTIPVTYLTETRAGKSHALNTAVEHARGDLLVFTDDDVLPSPKWLLAYALAFSETGADYAAGRILPLWEATPPRWLTPPLHGVLAVADGGQQRLILQGVQDEIMPIGANMAVRRHVLDRIGGWNPNLGKLKDTLRTGEDHEFALKLLAAGFAGVYEPDAYVLHRVPAERLRLGYFLRWCYSNGRIEAGLEHEYPSTTNYLLRVPGYLWRRMVQDLASTAFGILSVNLRTVSTAAMRIVWFTGYVAGRWTRAALRDLNVQSPLIERSWR
jgi:glycosyltransferase involved in cell wall biosynthesis